MNVNIRPFQQEDIMNKIRWVNDSRVNRYLHYELPLVYDKTLQWYERIKDRKDRLDLIIDYKGTAVGTIGLLSIDENTRSAEFYIMLGEPSCGGLGIAKAASILLLRQAFEKLNLHRVYLATEVDNLRAQGLFEHLGFQKDGFLRDELVRNGSYISRYFYSMLEDEYYGLYKASLSNTD